jgi:hypothetical protein
MEREHVQGLESLSGLDVTGEGFFIVFYLQNANPNQLKLTKLVYRDEMPLKVKAIAGGTSEFMTPINLWVKERDVPFRVGPVEGRSGMYKIAPEENIEPGVYAVHFGSIWIRMTDVFGAKYSGFDSGNIAYDFTWNHQPETPDVGQYQAPKQAVPTIPKFNVSIPTFASSEQGLNGALNYALSALQERKRATVPPGKDYLPTEEEEKAWKDMTAVSLDRALEALNAALNIATTLSNQMAKDLAERCVTLTDQTKKTLYSNKPFAEGTSYSKQKKAIKELKNYLSPKK